MPRKTLTLGPKRDLAKLDAMFTKAINRRVKVETQLMDMARGKLPMPTAEQLREMAIYLGTPDDEPAPFNADHASDSASCEDPDCLMGKK